MPGHVTPDRLLQKLSSDAHRTGTAWCHARRRYVSRESDAVSGTLARLMPGPLAGWPSNRRHPCGHRISGLQSSPPTKVGEGRGVQGETVGRIRL